MIADVKKTAEQKMKKTVETLKTDLAKIRTGRAHTGLLDHIVVDYYGTPTPVPQVGNVNAAAAALRNWAMNLHKELAGTGIQAAHVGIDVSIGTSVIPGLPTAQPEQISPVYWELHTTKRDQAELVFRL